MKNNAYKLIKKCDKRKGWLREFAAIKRRKDMAE